MRGYDEEQVKLYDYVRQTSDTSLGKTCIT